MGGPGAPAVGFRAVSSCAWRVGLIPGGLLVGVGAPSEVLQPDPQSCQWYK